MYGTEWCSHCKNQKAAFGSSFEYVYYVDCDKDKDECIKAGVKGYPTWQINGENYPGEQSFERLAFLTGCSVE
jgi:glutaredoxin